MLVWVLVLVSSRSRDFCIFWMVSEPVAKTICYRKSLGSSLGKLYLLYFPLPHYVTLEQKCNLDQSWSIRLAQLRLASTLLKTYRTKNSHFPVLWSLSSPKTTIRKDWDKKPPSGKIEIYVHCTHLFWAWIMTSGAWTLPRMSILHIFWFFLTIFLTRVNAWNVLIP